MKLKRIGSRVKIPGPDHSAAHSTRKSLERERVDGEREREKA